MSNAPAPMTLPVLTAADITRFLSEQKTGKGEYATRIKTFADSGELYLDFMSDPSFAGKEVSAIVQSVNGNLKKLAKADTDFPTCKVVKHADTVILVNMAVLAAQAVTEAEDEDA